MILHLNKLSFKGYISLSMSIFIMICYFILQLMLVLQLLETNHTTTFIGFLCIASFIPFFLVLSIDISNAYSKLEFAIQERTKELSCVYQVKNYTFNYTKNITNYLHDICRIIPNGWSDPENTICKIIYMGSVHGNDHNYDSSMNQPLILKDGTMIGEIIIYNINQSEFLHEERILLKTLAQVISNKIDMSIKTMQLQQSIDNFMEFESFVQKSILVSKTDAKGNIIYVNEKFEKISGYKSDEVLGRNHNILNSGIHNDTFWKNMYETTGKKEIWNKIVGNKRKDGSTYYVDTYIKANFENSILSGYTSIRQDITKIVETYNEVNRKNAYLEYAAKILRHDMHSGINTYMPRGISALERKLDQETIEKFKLEGAIKMIKEGLFHTQKVYKGVYEFTNMVKTNKQMSMIECNIKDCLQLFLSNTSYKSQVILEDMGMASINESLFCTAIDNLIRNGLKYNDSATKFVKVYRSENSICVEDNGRGVRNEEFEQLNKAYTRKLDQKESGSGLGLNICSAILKEHGFDMYVDDTYNTGTRIKIDLK